MFLVIRSRRRGRPPGLVFSLIRSGREREHAKAWTTYWEMPEAPFLDPYRTRTLALESPPLRRRQGMESGAGLNLQHGDEETDLIIRLAACMLVAY